MEKITVEAVALQLEAASLNEVETLEEAFAASSNSTKTVS